MSYQRSGGLPGSGTYAPLPAASRNPLTGWYHVDGYGAVGNGTTNDAAAIQAALDACGGAGGGTVYIPPKTHKISAPVYVWSNTILRGTGPQSVLKASFTGQGCVYNKNVSTTGDNDCSVIDICCDGSGTANQGVTFAGVQRGTIHNVRVKSCQGYGIWLWSASEASPAGNQGTPTRHVTVSSCHLTDIQDVGIEMDAAQSCTVLGNTINNQAGTAGIYVWNGATDCTITGNIVEGQGSLPAVYGYRVAGRQDLTYATQTARITFLGNVARNVKYGFKCVGASGDLPTDITFDDNSLFSLDSSNNGIELAFCSRVMVRNNHIEGFANPIRVADPNTGATSGTAQWISIEGNRVNGGGSIVMYGVAAGSFSNNSLYGQTNHCVNLLACSGLVVMGNRMADAGSSGTVGILLSDYSSAGTNGCVFIGNHTTDSRGTKWLGNVAQTSGLADYNMFIGNSARGAKTSTYGVQLAGTGTHNVVVHNPNGSTNDDTILSTPSNYTALQSDRIIIGNGTSITVTLPAPTGLAGRTYIVKNINATSLTVASASGQIDGAASVSLAQYATRTFITDGSGWYIIGN